MRHIQCCGLPPLVSLRKCEIGAEFIETYANAHRNAAYKAKTEFAQF